MADYAPNFTARLRVRYHAAAANHTQTWRYPGVGDGPEQGSAIVAVNNYLAAISIALWDDFAVLSTSFALRDSDVFLPVGGVAATGAIASATQRLVDKATALSFVGRTQAGLRVIIYQYGFVRNPGDEVEADDFRFAAGENGAVDAGVTSLQASGSSLVGNDGQPINWYPYANVKYNDYWVRKVRQG